MAAVSPIPKAPSRRRHHTGTNMPARRVRHYVGIRGITAPLADIVTGLGERGIHLSGRGGALRVSPNVYNDAEDIARLFTALDEILS